MSIKYHIPVFKESVFSYLQVENAKKNSVYVDATLGDGGHTQCLALSLKDKGIVISIDKDKEAIKRAKNRLNDLTNIIYVNDSYENLKEILLSLNISVINGIVFDLGLSSFHLDGSGRGFSFLRNEPLDMRMNADSELNAGKLVNTSSIDELADIIWKYGEERWSRKIAREIEKNRNKKPIEDTDQLVQIIKEAIPREYHPHHHHVATKTFQALRIAVNKELVDLKETLKTAVDFLYPGGRICIISFQSLEDRIAKETFIELSGKCKCPPNMPECGCNQVKLVKILTKKVVMPSNKEIDENPRSRSARLRVAERLNLEQVK
ncbi:MAG: 16S rRNA (cytosine(1402)-N(4))-methyltransferase RsmH [Candidatus Firestonebacteria bacterium]|nr:16S rRNA (cytosine(1402)-N(4))-methyltransferase RsmH [Candidatus Firestonebacteria bacterium]